MDLTFDQLESEVRAWADRNFPTSTDNESFHGVVEEVGELAHALIRHQEALDRADQEAEDLALSDILDAVGDTTVYLMDYASRREISISSVLADLGFPSGSLSRLQTEASMASDILFDPMMGLVGSVGDLAHSRLKARQGIRNGSHLLLVAERGAVGRIAKFLAVLCSREGIDYQTSVARTWAQVSRRDWVANPETGRAPEPITAEADNDDPPIVLPASVEKAMQERMARGEHGYPVLDAKAYLRGEHVLKSAPAEPDVYPARSTMPYETQ